MGSFELRRGVGSQMVKVLKESSLNAELEFPKGLERSVEGPS